MDVHDYLKREARVTMDLELSKETKYVEAEFTVRPVQ